MSANSIYIRNFHKEIPGGLSDDRKTWLFPKIESSNAHGRKTEWQIYVRLFKMSDSIAFPNVPMDAFVEILDSYLDNKPLNINFRGWIKVDSKIADGEIRLSTPTIVYKGKNLGKKSATNVLCQALRDALGIHNKQMKKVTPVGEIEKYPPMLAQILKDLKVPIIINNENPVFIQRKYNGVRAVSTLDKDGNVIMYSRNKLLYNGFSYIKEELKPIFEIYHNKDKKLYLDGEIYKHGAALQDISGLARRDANGDSHKDAHCDYVIYDCFFPNEPELLYSSRKKILDDIFEKAKLKYSKLVETFQVSSREEVDELYKSFLQEGYEGAMVRTDESYKYSYNGYHSRSLLKMKPTYDEEYEIIRWETGEKGKAADALMIVCITTEGKIFPVTPAIEIPERIALAKKMAEIEPNGKTHFENHWFKKKVIVYFDEKSKDNVPLRARTKLEMRID